MKKTILLFFLILTGVFGQEYSMRKCMILPVNDNLGGVLAFQVFERLEVYLKESNWCYYKSNSHILEILKNHQKGLDKHLKNPHVIQTVARKVRSGSLLRTTLFHRQEQTSVKLEVVSDNGKDLYFREEKIMSNADADTISKAIIDWLEAYAKSIPYDGQITGVLGTQFTIDVGKASLIAVGDAVDIVRPIRKKKHPLLKEIVDWETELLSHGKIFNTSEFQAKGKVTDVIKKRNLRTGDWVRKKTNKAISKDLKSKYDKVKKSEFGRLGQLSLHLDLGKGTGKNTQGTTLRKVSGLDVGFNLHGEVWATRNYFAAANLRRTIGKYSANIANVTEENTTATSGAFKLMAGYKYLPLGYFYGPQINGYLGYSSYSYDMDLPLSNGFSEVKFKGLMLGIKGDVPIKRDMRVYARLEWIPSPSYDESDQVFGEPDTTSSFMFQIGATYLYAPNIHLDGSIETLSNKAGFSEGEKISFNSTVLRGGVIFTY